MKTWKAPNLYLRLYYYPNMCMPTCGNTDGFNYSFVAVMVLLKILSRTVCQLWGRAVLVLNTLCVLCSIYDNVDYWPILTYIHYLAPGMSLSRFTESVAPCDTYRKQQDYYLVGLKCYTYYGNWLW